MPSRFFVRSLLCVAIAAAPVLAKDGIWRQDTPAAFTKAKKQGVVVTDNGAVRLSRALESTAPLEADRVWALSRGANDTIYAATGDKGQVWKRAGDGPWQTIYQAADTQVFALAAGPQNRLYLGTGPSGQVVELDPGGGEPKTNALGADVKYVWSLSMAPGGTLYAATGPNGQLWKRSGGEERRWNLVFDSPQSHLLSLAIDAQGNVFTGSDGAGLIYKITPEGKPSVVLDAPQEEIRVLRIGADKALYAGTATSAPGAAPGAGNRATTRFESSQDPHVFRVSRRMGAIDASQDTIGTARLAAGPAGDNVVYRIPPEGAAREIFRARALIHALAWQGDRLLIGTGPEGQLFEWSAPGGEVTALARIDHGQILALLDDQKPDSHVIMGTGDPGGVFALSSNFVESGVLTSEVFDTSLLSRFGSLDWKSTAPEGGAVTVFARTGNVAEPDDTWSDWQTPAHPGGTVRVPDGRFVQYQARLTRGTNNQSPELTSVRVAYQTHNLPPEIANIVIPDVSAGDGTAPRARLELKWDATDPNDDVLEYRVLVHKAEWPNWLTISGAQPLADKQLSWDTTAVPSGTYALKVTANDRRSNPADSAQETEKSSGPFIVDHAAPAVTLEAAADAIICKLSDGHTRLVKAEYALDGGPWLPAFTDDGLFDSPGETLRIPFKDLAAGAHVIVVRATDAAGNLGAGDLVFETK